MMVVLNTSWLVSSVGRALHFLKFSNKLEQAKRIFENFLCITTWIRIVLVRGSRKFFKTSSDLSNSSNRPSGGSSFE